MKACNAHSRASSVQNFRKSFGEEYPAAVMRDGIRMALQRENRFSRHYHSKEHKTGCVISRFIDNSASITASELKREWATWPKDLQIDFCQSSHWLFNQDDFQEMLRFILHYGNSNHWSAIALNVASYLPQQEAFDALVRALHNTEIGHTSNLTQGIAKTKHPSVEAVLRKHLSLIWKHPALWDDSTFLNWVAYDATNCIFRLIEVGAPPKEFAEQVQRLSQHVCSGNRESWHSRLSKHYPEITLQN